MDDLKTALAALNTAMAQYDATMVQATTALNAQLVAVRDAINAILEP